MPAELFALGAAILFACGTVAVKFATRTGNMMVGFMVNLATSVVAVGALAAVTVETWDVPPGPVALFALAGLAGPGAGRILSMRAVRDAGTTVAIPVQSSSNPLVASAAGVFLLGETVGLARGLALALVVTGIWACVRGGSANRAEGLELQGTERRGISRLLVLLLPLSAGAAYAAADTLRKFALAEHGDPVLGTFVGLATAFVVWLAIFLMTPQFRAPVRITPSLGWFCLSGLLMASASTSLLFALRAGDLSVVAPIVSSQPVIVIVLGALALRNVEKLRMGTVVGAVIVFVGVAALSMT